MYLLNWDQPRGAPVHVGVLAVRVGVGRVSSRPLQEFLLRTVRLFLHGVAAVIALPFLLLILVVVVPAHPVVDPQVPIGLPDAAAAARARRDRRVGRLQVDAPPVARALRSRPPVTQLWNVTHVLVSRIFSHWQQ